MATYEVEHNIPASESQPRRERQRSHSTSDPRPDFFGASTTGNTPQEEAGTGAGYHHPRRPDLSSFFSALELVDTEGTSDRAHNNVHAIPTPGDVAATFRTLADAFAVMRRDGGAGGGVDFGAAATATAAATRREGGEGENGWESLMDRLIEQLLNEADTPPREVRGVGQGFLDSLDRVPKKSLKEGDTCPICNTPFLEDPYPLVVRLPCHPSHTFDLECIGPWLRLHATCPLDRKDLLERRTRDGGVITPVSAVRSPAPGNGNGSAGNTGSAATGAGAGSGSGIKETKPAVEEEEEEWDDMYM